MKIEFELNRFEGDNPFQLKGDWWFNLGIGCQKTEFHHEYNWVFDIAFGFCTLYIRWK